MTMRLAPEEASYRFAKENHGLVALFKEPKVRDFKYWCIVENRFPHTRIAHVNHMIVLKRECATIRHIKLHEWLELLKVVWAVKDDYDNFAYNLPSMSSIRNIPHAHLYRFKSLYK